MVGWLRVAAQGRRVRWRVEYVERLSVMGVDVPCPPGLAPWRARGRLRRGERLLVRAGVGRVLVEPGYPGPLDGLRPVDPLPLYRGAADVLALGALEEMGVDPRRGRVALCAPWLSPEVRGAAERLCPRVRELLVDVPREGEDYARWLHRQYGLPVTPAGAGADVTLAFGAGGGRWGRALELYGPRPQLGGLELTAPGLTLPRPCRDQILALLWEAGAVGREGLRAARPALLAGEG